MNGDVLYPDVATYAGKIVNRELKPAERIFRLFGPGDATHGVKVRTSYSSGRPGGNSFWGLNEVPKNAEEWRQGSAVLDEWNRDGYIVIGTVLPGHSLPACTGVIAEHLGQKIGPQYLRGGAKQAMVKLPEDVARKLSELGKKVETTGYEVLESGGVRWELRATGWADANGIHGYTNIIPGPGAAQVARLPARVIASKTEDP